MPPLEYDLPPEPPEPTTPVVGRGLLGGDHGITDGIADEDHLEHHENQPEPPTEDAADEEDPVV